MISNVNNSTSGKYFFQIISIQPSCNTQLILKPTNKTILCIKLVLNYFKIHSLYLYFYNFKLLYFLTKNKVK